MKRRSRMIVGLIAAAVAASTTACSVNNASGGTGTGAGGTGTPASSDAITVALSGGLNNMDPQLSANSEDMTIYRQIYETLLQMDPKTHKLGPRLATSYKLVNPTTWRFELRHGVKFTDGETFDANSVKFSIERIMNPKNAATSATQLSTVKEVKIVDPYTVDIITKVPDPVLPRHMQNVGGTSGRVFMVPPKYFSDNNENTIGNHPVGTGPYKLKSWDQGQSLTLVANPDYWGKKPEVKSATFRFLTEDATRVNALLSGEVDLAETIPIEDLDQVDGSKTAHIAADSSNGIVRTILLDMRKPPFDNLKVREAFAHAIDLKGIISSLLKGHGHLLAVPMSPGVTQYDGSFKPYSYDPALSKKLLAEAGYPNGLTLNTMISDGRFAADKQIYEAINEQLGKVGIKVNAKTVEWGRLVKLQTSGGGGPFYIIGWDFGEADASKMNVFLRTGAGSSVADLKGYDELSAEAGQTTDPTKNKELWDQVQKLIYDNYVVGGVYQEDAIYGVSNRLEWSPVFGSNLNLQDIVLK